MSIYSNNHHFKFSSEKIFNEMVAYLWTEASTMDVEAWNVNELSFDPEEYVDKRDDLLMRCWLLSPTDKMGWMQLWASWGGDDEGLCTYLAAQFNCDCLYGHNNDQVDNWRWIVFEKGVKKDEFWYVGEREPLKEEEHSEAYKKMGRRYTHESFSSQLSSVKGLSEKEQVGWKVIRHTYQTYR